MGGGVSAASTQAQTQAKKHLLVLSDMPKGWKAEKGSTVSTSNGPLTGFPGAPQLAGCVGVPPSVFTASPPQATSPYFENADGALEVQDSVSVFTSVNDANAAYAAIESSKLAPCLIPIVNTGSFKSQALAGTPKGTTIGNVTVTEINPAHYGTNTAGVAIAIPATTNGISISIDITTVFFVKGRLTQEITFNSYTSAFPMSLAQHLTSVAERRL